MGNSSTLRREYELLEQLTDSIVVVNAVGEILLVNTSALKRWRYQSEQLLGESIFQLLDESESRISLPLSQIVGKTVDVKLRQGNGEHRKVVMSVSKLRAEDPALYLLIVKYSYPLALPRSTVSPQYSKQFLLKAANNSNQEQVAAGGSHLSFADDLREAIAQQQLQLYFQPQIDINTGVICGVEALCRWFHCEHGMIPPDKFITLAESVGIITELDLWVLRASCQQLLQWRAKGLQIPCISVNLSSVNLRYPALPELIFEVLQECHLTTDDVIIEITESGFVEHEPIVQDVINELYANGIQLSVDDFGIGYSNLSRLQTLPVSQLKLDRSLIEHIETSSIARSISEAALQIGKSMQLQVVAEGVESENQYQILKEFGFHVAQGYLFSAPLSVTQFERWVISQ
nr:EAL domain-containing protein [Shewanella dokdonensis]